MTPEEQGAFVESVCNEIDKRLDKRKKIDDAKHSRHHDYLELQMQREARRAQLVEHVKRTAVGAITIAFLSGVGWVGKHVLEYVTKGH